MTKKASNPPPLRGAYRPQPPPGPPLHMQRYRATIGGTIIPMEDGNTLLYRDAMAEIERLTEMLARPVATDNRYYVILHRFAKWEKGRWDIYQSSDSVPFMRRQKVLVVAKMKQVKKLDSRRMMRVVPADLIVPEIGGKL